MIQTSNQEKHIVKSDSGKRRIIEVITILVALIVTFYAGYSLGSDSGIDDKVKTDVQHTPITTSFSNPNYSTSTSRELKKDAPVIAFPN